MFCKVINICEIIFEDKFISKMEILGCVFCFNSILEVVIFYMLCCYVIFKEGCKKERKENKNNK